MTDIDLGYALYLWNTDKKGCFYCILHCGDELCPKDCTKEGYYKILMGDDLEWHYRMIEAMKWKERNRKRREERLKNQNND